MGELYNPYPKLPKNIRQIGERDQIVKLYVEDYVNTYLKRLYPMGGQDLRVGLLLGNLEMHEGTPYIFIDGAMEIEDVTQEGEKVVFTQDAWKKAYQSMEEMFPKRTVQGWFLCGSSGTQLSPLNYWKQHGQYFAGKNKLMYLNSSLDGEEAVYITSDDGFYKLQGYSIYYERNQMMQDYMVLRKDVKRVESGVNDTVIRDFRQRMEDKKAEVTTKRNVIGLLSGLCSMLSIIILAGGIVMFNNYSKMREMESVIASVMPQEGQAKVQETGEVYQAGKGDSPIVLEEASGNVFPTEAAGEESTQPPEGSESADPAAALEETSQTVQPETMTDSTKAETTQAETAAAEKAVQAEETKPAQTEPVKASGKTMERYTVQDGETLYGICMKIYHNLDRVNEICELNGLDSPDMIISGQQLVLP